MSTSLKDLLREARSGEPGRSPSESSPDTDSPVPPENDESLARQVADRAQDVLIRGARIDGSGVDVPVAGNALDQPDVSSAPVDVSQTGVPELVEREVSIEVSSGLPIGERITHRSAGEPALLSRDEQGGVDFEALTLLPFPADETLELVDDRVGQKNDLGSDLAAAPVLVDLETDSAPDVAAVEDVTDVERGKLELAEPGAESQSEQDVIAESVPVLAGDVEQAGLLDVGESDGGPSAPVGVRHDGLPPSTDIVPKPAVEIKRGPLGYVRRTEAEFAEWVATEIGFLIGIGQYEDQDIKLESYQRTFLADRSPYRCVEKARQVGYSWLFSTEALARTHLRESHNSIFVSYNLADSKEKIAYAAQLHEELPLEFQKKKIVDSKLELGFRSNSASKRVSRIISHPSRAPRGKKGDIYLDELAHYANDREVYKGSTALILRTRGQLTVCSSPLGRRGMFWEIARQEIRPYPIYQRSCVPWWLCTIFCRDVYAASIEAPKLSTRERVNKFGKRGIIEQYESMPLEDFQQEFEVSYVDESMSFFPYELILPCTNEELELAEDFSQVKPQGRLVAGFDVGRKKDLSELAVFDELDDGRLICRGLWRYERTKFSVQEGALRQLMSLLPIARLSIDQNGIGMHLTENLAEDFPQVEPETFSGTSKEVWATDFKILLQRRQVTLPRERGLISQIHSIRKRTTTAGRPIFESHDTADKGHADRFWAVALACMKERNVMGMTPQVSCKVYG